MVLNTPLEIKSQSKTSTVTNMPNVKSCIKILYKEVNMVELMLTYGRIYVNINSPGKYRNDIVQKTYSSQNYKSAKSIRFLSFKST